MASLIRKKKGHQLYYYVVESGRVDRQPRIVQQTYLGTAERLADLVKERNFPLPLSATTRDFGLPGALWRPLRAGVWKVLEALWPPPRSGPSTAHYLLLAAIHRICQPGPDRGRRLVPLHHFAAALNLSSPTFPLPGFLGCV